MTAIVDDTSPFGAYRPNALQRRLYRFMARLYGFGWAGKRIFGRLRWLDRRLAGSDMADVQRFGLRWRLYRTGNVSDSRLLLRPDSFDPLEMDCLLHRANPGFAFVDVGANCGFYALRIAAAGSRVVAVEPHPQMLRRLQFNLGLNPDCALRLLDCAVGDRHDSIRIAEDTRNLGRTRIDDAGAISAEMRPLLDIVTDEGLERLGALKVDVEGFEDRVLGPFLTDAPETMLPGIVIAEHTWSAQWADDWRQIADRRGYREWAHTPTGNVILIRDS
ncbi:MAG: FkbM family methyltransferase [Rhodospirillaceae bacterium]|nr:FkbM family methyltransferase [Rhodospirillaceae bacterium]